jgi:hypothetical protein
LAHKRNRFSISFAPKAQVEEFVGLPARRVGLSRIVDRSKPGRAAFELGGPATSSLPAPSVDHGVAFGPQSAQVDEATNTGLQLIDHVFEGVWATGALTGLLGTQPPNLARNKR